MLADARDVVFEALCKALLPDPELRLDVWSEENVIIPKGNAFEGAYRLRRTPPARRLLQALSPGHPASVVVAKVASQMLKTQVFINAALGWIAAAPANILALEPSDGLAKRLSNRFKLAAEACEVVDAKMAKARSRDSRNTVDAKEFEGGAIYLTTAGSVANLAELPARYLFCDEIDREGWKAGVGVEGNKVTIAMKRLTTYEGMSKAYLVSSPTHEGASEIDDWYERGTQEGYFVPCPHCGHLHELLQENFRYEIDEETGQVTHAAFYCPSCGEGFEEHHKETILLDEAEGGQARWVASSLGDGETISVRLSSFYAQLGSVTWIRMAREHAEAVAAKARGDHSYMQVYVNTRLGLSYAATDGNIQIKDLMDRAKANPVPPRVVPARALVVTQYADTQPNRLEVVTQAWGPGGETWIIDHDILWGNPTDPPDTPDSVWQRLDEKRRTPLLHESGVLIYASAYGIDSGGSNTQDVYNYGSAREAMTCIVTKGHSQRGKPVIASRPSLQEIDWQGTKIENGVKLWMIGPDTAKDHIMNRLAIKEGPGAMNFHSLLEEEFFKQLLVERRIVRWHKGRKISEYVKPNGARNEILDCVVGNLALAHYLGLHKWSMLDWQSLRDKLIPAAFTPDLFAEHVTPTLPPMPAQGDPGDKSTSSPDVWTAASASVAPPAPPPQPASPPPAPAHLYPATPQTAAPRRMLSRGI